MDWGLQQALRLDLLRVRGSPRQMRKYRVRVLEGEGQFPDERWVAVWRKVKYWDRWKMHRATRNRHSWGWFSVTEDIYLQ